MRRAESLGELIAAFDSGQTPEEIAPRIRELRGSEQYVFSAWVVATFARKDGISAITKCFGGNSTCEELVSAIKARGYVTATDVDAIDRLPPLDVRVLTAIALAEYARRYGFDRAVALVEMSTP